MYTNDFKITHTDDEIYSNFIYVDVKLHAQLFVKVQFEEFE